MRKKQIARRTCIILSLMLLFSASSFAQVTLSVKNQTIKQIIPQLEKATGYSVFYSNEMPGLDQKKDLNLNNRSVGDALAELFRGTDISYEIKADNQILLFHKQLKQDTSNTSALRGRIVDANGDPLAGVIVMLMNTNKVAVSDGNGNFSLDAPANSTIRVSQMGYEAQEIAIGTSRFLDITMQEDLMVLDDVVVIGYGTVRKKDLTGAVGVVNGQELATKGTTTLTTALQGSVPGLMVRRDGNAPGSSASSMHIRGVTTIGDSKPLIIVDDIPVDNLDHVNTNDVENISVLKDASAAAIYGSKAAAGVILVTTKRATQSDLSLTYNGEFGLEIPTYQPEMVGVTRYLEMSNELAYNDRPASGFFQTYSADDVRNWLNYNQTNPNRYPVTDWGDLMLKKNAIKHSHTVTISAGNKNVRTKASLTYDKVDGLYGDRYFERFMGRINNDFNINKMLSASLDISIRRAKNHTPNYSPFSSIRMMPAIYAATWDDGRIAEGKSGANPYGLLTQLGSNDSWSTQIQGKASIDFKPVKTFKVSVVFAPYLNYSQTKNFTRSAYWTLADDPDTIGGWLDNNNTTTSSNKLTENRNNGHNMTTQVLANYTESFGEHNLSVMAGYEGYVSESESLSASRDNYDLTEYPYLNVGPKDVMDNSGNANHYASNSVFGRIGYNYANKYLLQANLRYDASSRFDTDYQWGIFPSVSAGWVISEEKFFKTPALDWFSFLKLRASYGSLGNERIGDYPYMALINFSDVYFYQDGVVTPGKGAAQKKYNVRDITWETTTSTDVGVDMTFLRNRLRFSFDYYWKKTKGMLLTTQIPIFMGFENPDTNQGKMSTKGWEVELGWNDRKGDWTYGISANLSDFISTIDYLANGKNINSGKIQMAGVGFNEWYGYICEGIYQTQEDVDNSAKLNSQVTVGDLKYRDISGPDGVPDGVISADYDRVPLGNSLPRFQFGGNINVSWKGVDLSMAFQGVGKQNVRLAREMVEPLRNNYGNIPAIIDNKYWSAFNTAEQNAKAKYPRLTATNRDANYAVSDFWLFNGGYFRMKNITLGYTLPSHITKKALIEKIRVYASASDLFVISKFPKGWDPEMGVSSYPITTSIIFGLSVTF